VLARMATETIVYMGWMQARLDRAKSTGLTCRPTKPVPWVLDWSSGRKPDKNMDMAFGCVQGEKGAGQRFEGGGDAAG
jgi:hypothetical protein